MFKSLFLNLESSFILKERGEHVHRVIKEVHNFLSGANIATIRKRKDS
jgi:hypothetical protein